MSEKNGIDKKILLIITITLCILGITLFFILNSFMITNLSELDGEGELQNSFVSPSKEYRADIFLIDKGGATVSYQIRVSITSLKDKSTQFNNTTVYWQYPSNDAVTVEWVSDDEVNVDGKQIRITDSNTYYNWKNNE